MECVPLKMLTAKLKLLLVLLVLLGPKDPLGLLDLLVVTQQTVEWARMVLMENQVHKDPLELQVWKEPPVSTVEMVWMEKMVVMALLDLLVPLALMVLMDWLVLMERLVRGTISPEMRLAV